MLEDAESPACPDALLIDGATGQARELRGGQGLVEGVSSAFSRPREYSSTMSTIVRVSSLTSCMRAAGEWVIGTSGSEDAVRGGAGWRGGAEREAALGARGDGS